MPRKSSYTTAVKLQVIEFADTHGNHGAAQHFIGNKNNVHILKQKHPRIIMKC